MKSKLTRENWLQEFRRIYVDENYWKSEDGVNAYVTIENMENFIKKLVNDLSTE